MDGSANKPALVQDTDYMIKKLTIYLYGPFWGLLNRPVNHKGLKRCFHKGIDGFAHKPALRQDTGYMVEKTYHIASYLGAFGVYLVQKVFR